MNIKASRTKIDAIMQRIKKQAEKNIIKEGFRRVSISQNIQGEKSSESFQSSLVRINHAAATLSLLFFVRVMSFFRLSLI